MHPERLEGRCCHILWLLAAVPWVSGCASQQWKKQVLYSKDGTVLYAEHKENEKGPVPQGFLHPVHVPPEAMDAILSRIVYKHRPLIGENEDRLLFEKQDVAALSEPIRLALDELTPDERLRFLVVRDSWASLLTGPKATSGVMFVREEGVLNVAVDRIRESVTIAEGGNPSEVSFPYEPTEYLSGDPVIPFGGTKLHVDAASNRRFPRWLEVELAEVKPAATAPTAAITSTATAAEPANTASGTAEGDPPARATEGGAPAHGAAETETKKKSEEERYSELRRKLETLERLKEDGVLTEEQYQQQFEKIMSEL